MYQPENRAGTINVLVSRRIKSSISGLLLLKHLPNGCKSIDTDGHRGYGLGFEALRIGGQTFGSSGGIIRNMNPPFDESGYEDESMVTKEQVILGYQLVLEREPESVGVIEEKMKCGTTLDLLEELLKSDEFLQKNGGRKLNYGLSVKNKIIEICLGNNASLPGVDTAETLPDLLNTILSSETFLSRRHVFDGDRLWRFLGAPAMRVDVDVDDVSKNRLRSLVEGVWHHLGENDPYWSVMSDEQFRGELENEKLDLFYASGEIEARFLIKTLERNGIDRGSVDSVLEYGCGVGRVTNWLCKEFFDAEIVGVDISSAHLKRAERRIEVVDKLNNFKPYHIANLAALDNLPKFHVGYSRIVLQHNPPPIIKSILDALLGSLKENGLLVLQIPVYAENYRFDCQEYIKTDGWCGRGEFEIHVLPQKNVHDSIEKYGCRLLEVFPDQSVGKSDWLSLFFVIQKRCAE